MRTLGKILVALGFLSAILAVLMLLADALMIITGCHDKPWTRQMIDTFFFSAVILFLAGWLLPDFFQSNKN